jgi:hypothetical protein
VYISFSSDLLCAYILHIQSFCPFLSVWVSQPYKTT